MTGYRDVCEAKTQDEMVRRFEALLNEVAEKHGGTPESHRPTQLSNVGYFSGYYSSETAKRVLDWLGATHPFFGTAHAHATLKAEDAFKAGLALGRTAHTTNTPEDPKRG